HCDGDQPEPEPPPSFGRDQLVGGDRENPSCHEANGEESEFRTRSSQADSTLFASVRAERGNLVRGEPNDEGALTSRAAEPANRNRHCLFRRRVPEGFADRLPETVYSSGKDGDTDDPRSRREESIRVVGVGGCHSRGPSAPGDEEEQEPEHDEQYNTSALHRLLSLRRI